jgi:putative ABC transport system permease protein
MRWQNWMYTLPLRLRSIFRREDVERELEEEMQYHLDRKIEQGIATGLDPAQARRAAVRAMEGIEQQKEACRDQRKVNWLEDFVQDVRFAVRTLRRNPGFTVIALLTLALGIGANAAIFSVIDGVLLRPLPYGTPSQLVMVWEWNTQHDNRHNTVSPPNFLDWQKENHVFSEMAYLADTRTNLTGDGEPEQIVALNTSANFFSTLGVRPMIGPGFLPENGQEGKNNVVVLSYGLWKRRYAADPAIVGKTIRLSGKPQVVTGVMSEDFKFFIKDGTLTGEKPQIFTPWVFPREYEQLGRIGRFLSVVARLKPGVSASQAQTEIAGIAARLAREYPDFDGNWSANVVPIREQLTGEIRPALLILLGAVGFVLLIACANVSSLLLARAANRERELGIRTAMGASRWRMARQLLTESLLLAVVGGALGVITAIWSTNLLLVASPTNLLELTHIETNWDVVAFSCGMAILAGVLFGFLPSYVAARGAIADTLKEGGRNSSAGRNRSMLRSGFVVAQIGMALVLLTGSGLLIRSFAVLLDVQPGFDPKNVLTFTVALPNSKYGQDSACLAFFRDLLSRLAKIPGVTSVSMDSFPPMSGLGAATDIKILSKPPVAKADLPGAAVRVVGPDYFRTLGIPLRAGREFDARELSEMRHVAMVNQAFVDQYMSGMNPLGQKIVIYMKSLTDADQTSEIIGVVGNVRLMGLDAPAQPVVYWPHPELVYSKMGLLVRTSGDPKSVVSAARDAIRGIDPDEPMANIATMEEVVSASYARSRFTMIVLGMFAALALVLAAVGIYGVIAYSVAQRTAEIGIRVAMGAQRADVLRLILGQGSRLILTGAALGVVCALALTRLLRGMLFQVSAADPLTFACVAAILVAVAFLACYLPARRAMHVDPLVALRYE